jgi:hypothetical protein
MISLRAQVTTETLEPASLVDLESSIVALKSSQSSLSTSVKDLAQGKIRSHLEHPPTNANDTLNLQSNLNSSQQNVPSTSPLSSHPSPPP